MIWKQDGSVWSTSIKADNRVANFVQVIASDATVAAAGKFFSIVLKQDGNVMLMGKSSTTRLSFLGETQNWRMFSVVKMIFGAKAVAAGGYHGIVLTREGLVLGTGWNKHGQLGDGTTDDKSRFVQMVTAGLNIAAIAAGEAHSVLVTQDGCVIAAGLNSDGQLGDGSKTDSSSFVYAISSGVGQVATVDVAAGSYHSLVIKEDGSVWATGCNKYGQLGDGSKAERLIYVQVLKSAAKAVVAGNRHSMVLKQDGSVWATGDNLYGQLGDGSTTSTSKFVQVISDGVKLVAAGALHSMALKQDESLWATGSNIYGQLGDGTTKSRKVFDRVTLFGIHDNGAEQHTIIRYTLL